MKKLLKISLGAMLAALPMLANAADVPGDPGATTASNATVTAGAPKYAVETANTAVDGTLATVGYVKGAYNAVIAGVNAVHDEISGLNSDLSAYATKSDVESAINMATVNSGNLSTATIDSGATFAIDSTSFDSQTIDGTLTATVALAGTWGEGASNVTDSSVIGARFGNATITGTANGSITGAATGTHSGVNSGALTATYVQG